MPVFFGLLACVETQHVDYARPGKVYFLISVATRGDPDYTSIQPHTNMPKHTHTQGNTCTNRIKNPNRSWKIPQRKYKKNAHKTQKRVKERAGLDSSTQAREAAMTFTMSETYLAARVDPVF